MWVVYHILEIKISLDILLTKEFQALLLFKDVPKNHSII